MDKVITYEKDYFLLEDRTIYVLEKPFITIYNFIPLETSVGPYDRIQCVLRLITKS